jgi:hypothetical protein
MFGVYPVFPSGVSTAITPVLALTFPYYMTIELPARLHTLSTHCVRGPVPRDGHRRQEGQLPEVIPKQAAVETQAIEQGGS